MDEQVVLNKGVSLPTTRDPDWYIPEGNIILALACGTENSDGGILFRVFKSQLAKHSTFYQDMFSLPQPPAREGAEGDREELYDGCQVLRLNDSISDLRSLFDLIWNIPRVSFAQSFLTCWSYPDRM